MNIAQLVLSLDFGGQEKLIILLAQKLKSRGLNTLIITLESEGSLIEEAKTKGIEVVSVQKRGGLDLGAIFRLKKILNDHRIDILHTHNFAPLVYGTIAARLAGIKSIVTRHGRAKISAPGFLWDMNEFIVTVSQDAFRELFKNNRIKNPNVKVIYNGIAIPAQRCDPPSRSRLKESIGVPADRFVIGTVARLAREKDHKTLLKAFRMLRDRNVNAELLIVGGGELEGELKRLAHDLHIEERVKFLGFREDVSGLLDIFDVFVLSTFMEGISLTILEAMAHAKPVVATAVGGNPEIIVEEETGLLVPVQDPEAMAKAIGRVLLDKSLGGLMGENGRKRVEKKFNLEKMVDTYVDVYHQVRFFKDIPEENVAKGEGRRAKILVFTNVFPRDFEPNKGLNIWEQIKRLRKEFDIKIISAVARNIFSEEKAGAPARIIFDGLDIFQPKYWTLPKLGVLTSGFSYYHVVKKTVKGLRKYYPFDLIIAYWSYPDGFAAAKIAREFKVPLIIRPRGSDINVGLTNPFLRRMINETFKRADRIIPVSESLRAKIQDLGVPAEKLGCIVNGVDAQFFFPKDKEECRRKLGVPPDKKVVLFVGNLIEIKGLEYYLPAIQKLDTEANRQLSFYFLGSGKFENQIRQLSAELKNCQIRLVGEVQRASLPDWMNAADLFCLPSLNEGCPNVLMEALACGLPVVATNVGGIPEIINSEKLGILMPPGDAGHLARAVTDALSRSWRKEDLLKRIEGETWEKAAERLREECLTITGTTNRSR